MALPTPGDRAAETSTTTGTGTYSLGGAITGWQGIVAACGTGATVDYFVRDQAGGADFEVGRGVITDAATDTLSRVTILSSSNAGAAVSWPAGTRDIVVTFTADAFNQMLANEHIGVTVQAYDATLETGATADQTAAEILTALKTVDVDGTAGVNAGTFDGLLSTEFLRSNVSDTMENELIFTRNANNILTSKRNNTTSHRVMDLFETGGLLYNLRPYPLGSADATKDFGYDFTNSRWYFDASPYVGANAVLDTADLGVSVQAYDANTSKTDVAETRTGIITFNDVIALAFGTGQDAAMYFDGSDFYFNNDVGNIKIQNRQVSGQVTIVCDDSGGTAKPVATFGEAGSTLYHKGLTVLNTKVGGIVVVGDVAADTVTINGNDALDDADIGVTVQGYDATIVVDADIGSTVQAYDVDTAKLDVVQSFTAAQTFKEVGETQYSLTGTVIDPANGTLQYKTLAANTTFTESLVDGQSVTLLIDDGSFAYTATWPTITWVGGAAPTLPTTGYAVIELWQINAVLYGMHSGDA